MLEYSSNLLHVRRQHRILFKVRVVSVTLVDSVDSVDSFFADYETSWEINKLVVEDIISCNAESFAFLIGRLITLKSNISGFSVCPICQIREKERVRLRKAPKKLPQSNFVGGPPPSASSSEDRSFIGFLKHLLAGGFYAVCSVTLVPKSLVSIQTYDSVRQKSMVGLLFPTSFSQCMLYFYPDDLESFRRVVFASPSVKLQKTTKEGDTLKMSSSSSSAKLLESTEFSSKRNDKVRKFQENLFDKVRKNADAHQKHLEVLYNESTLVPDLPRVDVIAVKRSSSMETVFSGLSNMMEDTDTCVDQPPVEMIISAPHFTSNYGDNREDSSSIFRSLKERSISHSEQTNDTFRLSSTVCEENKNSINFFTSATGLEDISKRDLASNAYTSFPFPPRSRFVLDDAVSTINFPNLSNETNHSLTGCAKEVHESKDTAKQPISNGDKQYSFIGVLSSLVSLFSHSPDKATSAKPLDLKIVEGVQLDAMLDDTDEIMETTNEEDISNLLHLPSSQSSGPEVQNREEREQDNGDDATVSTVRDDVSNELMRDCLEKEISGCNKDIQKEKSEFMQRVFVAFPKVSSISPKIIGGLWESLFTNSGKNISQILQDDHIVGITSAERKKVNKSLKETLKGRLGSDPFFIEILASLALFQVFLNLQWCSVDNSGKQNKEELKDIVSSVELALQKLSLAMGSPFFQCQYLSNLLPSFDQSDRIVGMNDVIYLIRNQYQKVLSDGKLEKLIDEYDDKRRLENLSPDKSIGSQSSTDNESNVINQKINSIGATNIAVVKTTELKRTTSLLTKKQPVLGHRMNMGMKRAVTMVTNLNNSSGLLAPKNFKSSDSNLKTGKKRSLEETVSSQKHILKSPNPPKKKRLSSEDLETDSTAFRDESFISPETFASKSRRFIASPNGEKNVIESTPVQNYVQSKNFNKGTRLFD